MWIKLSDEVSCPPRKEVSGEPLTLLLELPQPCLKCSGSRQAAAEQRLKVSPIRAASSAAAATAATDGLRANVIWVVLHGGRVFPDRHALQFCYDVASSLNSWLALPNSRQADEVDLLTHAYPS